MFHVNSILEGVSKEVISGQESKLVGLLQNDSEARKTLDFINRDAKLKKAYDTAKVAHAGQERSFGKHTQPYIFHTIDVVGFLRQSGVKDINKFFVAILHDSLEEQKLTVNEVVSMFGKDIAKYVSQVNLQNDTDDNFYKTKIVQPTHEFIRDVKLADRLSKLKFFHGLRGGFSPEKKTELVTEYENLKTETGKHYNHWFDNGTNVGLRKQYALYMMQNHSDDSSPV